jgi:hypothetical protein
LGLKDFVAQLAECVKDLTDVATILEKRIQELEKKADKLLKEAKDGSRGRSGGVFIGLACWFLKLPGGSVSCGTGP